MGWPLYVTCLVPSSRVIMARSPASPSGFTGLATVVVSGGQVVAQLPVQALIAAVSGLKV